MGKPESLADFKVFMDEDVEIYIERTILDKYIIDDEILMVVEGIGRFKLENIEDCNLG